MKKYIFSIMGIVLLLLTLGLSPSYAALVSIDTSVGNGADTYISTWPGEADTNLGDQDTLYLKNDSGTGFVNRKIYVRFDLSAVTAAVSDATFSLRFFEDTDPGGGNRSFNVYGLVDGHAQENWDELSITWNTAPANNTGSGSGLISGQYVSLGNFEFNSAGAATGDVASFSSDPFTQFLQEDTNDLATLIIIRRDRTLTNIGFAAKENSDLSGPALLVQTVPIPSGIYLFCLGLSGLAIIRRTGKRG